jgi:hypothetical protein
MMRGQKLNLQYITFLVVVIVVVVVIFVVVAVEVAVPYLFRYKLHFFDKNLPSKKSHYSV